MNPLAEGSFKNEDREVIPGKGVVNEDYLPSMQDSPPKKADGVLAIRVSVRMQSLEKTLEEAINRYGPRLYSVSLGILKNAQDAEDAVQETFLKAFQSMGSFRGKSSLYTWLYRIAVNQSLGKLRQRHQRKLVPIEPCLLGFEQESHDQSVQTWGQAPDRALYIRQFCEFLDKCIQGLPHPCRRAYVLKDVEKLSEDQVCRILGISKSAMKNRAHRARLILRKRVQEDFLVREPFLEESARC